MTRRKRRNTVTVPRSALPRDWREMGIDHVERDELMDYPTFVAYAETFAPHSVDYVLMDMREVLESGRVDAKFLSRDDVEACPKDGPPMPSHFRRDGSCRCDEHHAALAERERCHGALIECRTELRMLRAHIETLEANLGRIAFLEEAERDLDLALAAAEEWVFET